LPKLQRAGRSAASRRRESPGHGWDMAKPWCVRAPAPRVAITICKLIRRYAAFSGFRLPVLGTASPESAYRRSAAQILFGTVCSRSRPPEATPRAPSHASYSCTHPYPHTPMCCSYTPKVDLQRKVESWSALSSLRKISMREPSLGTASATYEAWTANIYHRRFARATYFERCFWGILHHNLD